MADPIMPNAIRAMCVLQNSNGLPADRYVTTWAFACTSFDPAVHPDAIKNALAAFWNEPVGALSNLASYVSGQAMRGANSKVISYSLAEAPPRTPHERLWTLGNQYSASSPLPYPAEVAVVASLRTDHNGPRGKGRVYLGPLNTLCGTDSESGEPRPSTTFRMLVADRCKALAESAILVDAGLSWAVLSHADAALYEVTGGWCDNAFDTQRRRGLVTSTRTQWVKA